MLRGWPEHGCGCGRLLAMDGTRISLCHTLATGVQTAAGGSRLGAASYERLASVQARRARLTLTHWLTAGGRRNGMGVHIINFTSLCSATATHTNLPFQYAAVGIASFSPAKCTQPVRGNSGLQQLFGSKLAVPRKLTNFRKFLLNAAKR